jgi:hypothetical protein
MEFAQCNATVIDKRVLRCRATRSVRGPEDGGAASCNNWRIELPYWFLHKTLERDSHTKQMQI